jgi:hypothetical protein
MNELPTNVVLLIAHLLCEQDYVIHCVGNMTEEISRINISEFPTGVLIVEIGSK